MKKHLRKVLAVLLVALLLGGTLMAMAEAPEEPSVTAEPAPEPVPEPVPEPEPEVTAEPVPEPTAEPVPEAPLPEVPVEPAPEETEVPPVDEPTAEPAITPAPETGDIPSEAPSAEPETPPEPPLAAEALASELGITVDELAAELGLTVDELLLLDEATLDELYAQFLSGADDAMAEIAISEPGTPNDLSDFVIDNLGTITDYRGDSENVVIPSGPTSIASTAFARNTYIKSIYIPDGIDIMSDAFADCPNLESVRLPETLEYVREYTFGGCSSLKSIDIPDSVKGIWGSAFMGCSSLEYVGISEQSSLTSLSDVAFSGCKSLNHIILPVSVTSLGGDVFANCTNLEYVICYDTLKSVYENATFKGCPNVTVYVYVRNTNSKSYMKQYCDKNKVKCEQYPYGTPLPPGSAPTPSPTPEPTPTPEPGPSGFSLNFTELTLGVNEQRQLSYTFTPEGMTSAVSFASDTPQVADVMSSGLVTANGVGSANITATTANGLTATCVVTVMPAPRSVTIANNPVTLGIREPYVLEAKVNDGGAGTITFESGNPAVLAVDKDTGELTATKVGSAEITATSYNGKSASVTITVKPAPTRIRLNMESLNIDVGEPNVKLRAGFGSAAQYGHVTWSSSNEEIVTIEAGRLIAHSGGSAVVTASVYNKANPANPYEAQCSVRVSLPREPKLYPEKPEIGVGEEIDLKLNFNGSSAKVVRYMSSEPGFAKVTADNKIRGVQKGEATITAVLDNGSQLQAFVNVVAAPSKLSITNKPEPDELSVGDSWTPEFRISGYGGDDISGVVTHYTSSNERVAYFEDGVLRIIGRGTATITCRTYNSRSDRFNITVK